MVDFQNCNVWLPGGKAGKAMSMGVVMEGHENKKLVMQRRKTRGSHWWHQHQQMQGRQPGEPEKSLTFGTQILDPSIWEIWEPQPPFPNHCHGLAPFEGIAVEGCKCLRSSPFRTWKKSPRCTAYGSMSGDPAVMCCFGACFLWWNPKLLMIKSQFSVVKSMCLIIFDPDIVHSPILMDRSRFLLPTVIPIFHDPNPMFGLRSHMCLVLKIRSVR